MQQSWVDKAHAVLQAHQALLHENTLLRAMQENARLARENQMLRSMPMRQAQAPPGLADTGGSQAPLAEAVPETKFSRSKTAQRSDDSCDRVVSFCGSEGSTNYAPSRPSSFLASSSEVSTSFCSNQPNSFCSNQAHSFTSNQPNSFCSSLPSSQDIQSFRASKQSSDQDPNVPLTSAMLRNLPNDYTQAMLLKLLHAEGFAETFDFVYLPVDFRSGSGLGYAFVNFTSPDTAEEFHRHFSGFNEWSVASDKVCEVTWSSLQGLEAHVQRYRNSPVMHESVPEEHKPALFVGSEAVPFAAPTKKIPMPKHGHRRRQQGTSA